MAFAAKQLQPSGRDPSFSGSASRARSSRTGCGCTGGSALEPARFEGAEPRLHGTTGAQLRLFAFNRARGERRVPLSGASDVASRYQNVGLSLGFWS